MSVVVHPADIQDRDGAFQLLRRARRLFPFIKRIFADGGYAGEKMALIVWRTGAWRLQIVKRSDAAGFEVLPKRWIVERTFAWISRNRRLARDFERYAITVAAFIRLAMIRSCSGDLLQTPRHEFKLLGWALRYRVPCCRFPPSFRRYSNPAVLMSRIATAQKGKQTPTVRCAIGNARRECR